MQNTVKNYYGYTFMEAATLLGSEYVIERSEKDDKFSDWYFSHENLIYLDHFLSNDSDMQPFTDEKLEDVRKIMKYYIGKSDSPVKIKLCEKIIRHAKHQNPRKLERFYQSRYQTQYNTDGQIQMNKEFISNLEIGIVNDFIVLATLLDGFYNNTIFSLANNTAYLLSVRSMINECPELLHSNLFMENLKAVLYKNIEYEENTQLAELNQSLLTQVIGFYKRESELFEQYREQWLLSLIFSHNIDNILRNMSLKGIENNYFNETTFQAFCRMVKENTSSCIFGEEQIANARKILFHFTTILPIETSIVNNLRSSLNISIDQQYRRKNKESYITMFRAYRNTNYVGKYSHMRWMCDKLIGETADVLWGIIDYNTTPKTAAKHSFLPYQLNYIFQIFPAICKDEAYLSKVEDMLYWMEQDPTMNFAENIQMEKSRKILQKKIKKLQQ